MNTKRFRNIISKDEIPHRKLFRRYKKFKLKASEAQYNYDSAVADLYHNEEILEINKKALKNFNQADKTTGLTERDKELRETLKEQIEFGVRYRSEHTVMVKYYKERTRIYRELSNSYRMAWHWCVDYMREKYKNTNKEITVEVAAYDGGGIRVQIKDELVKGEDVKIRNF